MVLSGMGNRGWWLGRGLLHGLVVVVVVVRRSLLVRVTVPSQWEPAQKKGDWAEQGYLLGRGQVN